MKSIHKQVGGETWRGVERCNLVMHADGRNPACTAWRLCHL